MAKSLGFQDVTVIDLISDKLQRAKNFGGNTLLIEMNSTPDDVAGQIKEKLGVYPDLVVDAVGVKASFDQAFQMVSEKGNLLLIGNLAKSVELPLQDLVSKEISLVGTYGFDLKAFRQGVETLPEFKDQLQTFIEGHCTLEETPEVMTALAKGERKALKIVIDFE